VTVYLCTGKACRKKKSDHRELRKQLESCTDVEEVGCQKCCSGPVVGIEVKGKLEWFTRLRSGGLRRDAVRSLREGSPSKTLWKRREKKRSGKLR
jgi:hypothetical protein